MVSLSLGILIISAIIFALRAQKYTIFEKSEAQYKLAYKGYKLEFDLGL